MCFNFPSQYLYTIELFYVYLNRKWTSNLQSNYYKMTYYIFNLKLNLTSYTD